MNCSVGDEGVLLIEVLSVTIDLMVGMRKVVSPLG